MHSAEQGADHVLFNPTQITARPLNGPIEKYRSNLFFNENSDKLLFSLITTFIRRVAFIQQKYFDILLVNERGVMLEMQRLRN